MSTPSPLAARRSPLAARRSPLAARRSQRAARLRGGDLLLVAELLAFVPPFGRPAPPAAGPAGGGGMIMRMKHIIRAVDAEDWPKIKQLRLDALLDPAAPIAFHDSYEKAAAQPDEFWQERAAGAAEGVAARQFVAEAADGRWLGTVSVLVEHAGTATFFGDVPEQAQTHVVGVFVRSEARGSGVAQGLFEAALDWSWSLAEPRVERVRLFVHEANGRAGAMYRKTGFEPTGHHLPAPGDGTAREIELAVRRG
ncbi:GNAT family N-acetyltransferase [Kitasatospora sp. NPDC001603]|uniref:GNAT family N-acetyltransferase n=1 Tax=Kitasatospora sp. NPDC001603 TaxID=3154388 RepID=UPI003328FB39